MSTETFLTGIGVIAACIIAIWQLWPIMTTKREKAIFTSLMGSLLIISLVLMFNEFNKSKDTEDENNVLSENEKSIEIEDIEMIIQDKWREEDSGDLVIGSQEGEYRLSMICEDETGDILYKPRIRVWVERVGFISNESAFLEDKYQDYNLKSTRVKGYTGIEFEFEGKENGIDIYKKTLVFLYKENEYKILGVSEISKDGIIMEAFKLIRRKTLFQ